MGINSLECLDFRIFMRLRIFRLSRQVSELGIPVGTRMGLDFRIFTSACHSPRFFLHLKIKDYPLSNQSLVIRHRVKVIFGRFQRLSQCSLFVFCIVRYISWVRQKSVLEWLIRALQWWKKKDYRKSGSGSKAK